MDIGISEFFGDEDLVHGRDRTYSVVCTSAVGEILRIDRKIFFSKLMRDSLKF